MTPSRPWKLALVQMSVLGGRKSENVRQATSLIHEAASNGAELVLLPEAFNLGWCHPAAFTEAEPIPDGPTFQCLAALARKLQIYLCAGLVEKADSNIFNSAVLIHPQGHLLLHHRKLNELEIAHDFYAQGDRLQVAHTPLGTLGLIICADAFASQQILSRALAWMGAQVILSPCAWAVPPDHDNLANPYGSLWLQHYQPVARQFQIYIAAASNVGLLEAGPWNNYHCIGCSMVIGPDGTPRVRGPYGSTAQTILYDSLQPQPRRTRGDGWNHPPE